MADISEAFVAFDTSKLRNAVAIAEAGRAGEVRFLGEIDNTEAAVAKLVRKLAAKYGRLTFCYEAGPTGYGLDRQIMSLGHECLVVAPSLILKKPGERVKTNRRDAVSLVKQLRGGDLTAVWVPDPRHEAMLDLTRAREAAVQDLRRKRQQVSAFLLRQGRCYPGERAWTKTHRNWLASQKLEYPTAGGPDHPGSNTMRQLIVAAVGRQGRNPAFGYSCPGSARIPSPPERPCGAATLSRVHSPRLKLPLQPPRGPPSPRPPPAGRGGPMGQPRSGPEVRRSPETRDAAQAARMSSLSVRSLSHHRYATRLNIMSWISGRRSNTRRTRARWQPAVLKPVHGGTSRSQR
jgi:hypothetical protein